MESHLLLVWLVCIMCSCIFAKEGIWPDKNPVAAVTYGIAIFGTGLVILSSISKMLDKFGLYNPL